MNFIDQVYVALIYVGFGFKLKPFGAFLLFTKNTNIRKTYMVVRCGLFYKGLFNLTVCPLYGIDYLSIHTKTPLA